VFRVLPAPAAPPDLDPQALGFLGFLNANPLALAALYVAIYIISVILAIRVGRAFGGVATDLEAAAAMTLLHILSMLVNIAEAVLLLLSPGLAALLTFAAIAWLFYLSAVFLDEVHQFGNVVGVMGGIVFTLVVCLLCAGVALAFLTAIF
jgi:hypothetical protein